jgi:hypothetical protein
MKKPMPMKKKASPKAETAATPAPPGSVRAEDMKWAAQDGLRTLTEAHKIKNDPHLMHHIKEHAKTQRDALNKVIRRK